MDELILKPTGFKEVAHFGVSHLMNFDRSVAVFNSWHDIDDGTFGMVSDHYLYQDVLFSRSEHQIYKGLPFTQKELNMYYEALRGNTFINKSKIGLGKVLFKGFKEPIAIEYKEKVYLVAPYFIDASQAPKDPYFQDKAVIKEGN